MPTDSQALAERVRAARPADTVRGFIFNGVLRCLKEFAGEAAERECLAKLGKPRWVEFFSYPVADYLKLAWTGVEFLEPKVGGVEQSFFRLGHYAASSFLTSAVGKVLTTIAANEPRKMVSNFPTAYKMCVGYGERTVTWSGEGSALLAVRNDFLVPAFHEGAMSGAVSAAGGKDVRVVGKRLSLLDVDYSLTWD